MNHSEVWKRAVLQDDTFSNLMMEDLETKMLAKKKRTNPAQKFSILIFAWWSALKYIEMRRKLSKPVFVYG